LLPFGRTFLQEIKHILAKYSAVCSKEKQHYRK